MEQLPRRILSSLQLRFKTVFALNIPHFSKSVNYTYFLVKWYKVLNLGTKSLNIDNSS